MIGIVVFSKYNLVGSDFILVSACGSNALNCALVASCSSSNKYSGSS
jgi:hypothetical protein